MNASEISMGFAMMTYISYSSSFYYTTTNYYFTSYSNNTIFVFDDNWNYLYNKAFSSPLSIVTVGDIFYVTNSTSIHKTDKNLKINKTYTMNYCCNWYSAFYYNQTSNLMYVGGFTSNRIDILDSNLNIVENFYLTENFTVSTIQGHKNYLYIGIASINNGSAGGKILVLLNNVIVQNVYGCFNSYILLSLKVFSILFDENGYMATSCNDGQANLFNQSLSYIYKSTNFDSALSFMSLDSKNRLITLSVYNVINIYSSFFK